MLLLNYLEIIKMKFEELALMFENGHDFSRKTGLPHGNFHNWKKWGYIPIGSQIRLQGILGGELKANFDDVPDKIVYKKEIKTIFEKNFDTLLQEECVKKEWLELEVDMRCAKLSNMIRKLKYL